MSTRRTGREHTQREGDMDRQEWLNSLGEGSEVVIITNGRGVCVATVTHVERQSIFVNGRRFNRKTGEGASKRCVSRLEQIGSEVAINVATVAEIKRTELGKLLKSMRGEV